MSSAEIADNKWEANAAKAPITTPAGLLLIALICGFTLLFGFIVISSIGAIVSPPTDAGFIESKIQEAQSAPQP